MNQLSQISEILATYEKYGWVLRRILLKKPALKPGELASDVQVSESDIDAAWFSRPPQAGEIAWEIRYLGNTPLALLEHLDEADPDFELKLKEVEARLTKSVASKRN